jgi:hypothetical protein
LFCLLGLPFADVRDLGGIWLLSFFSNFRADLRKADGECLTRTRLSPLKDTREAYSDFVRLADTRRCSFPSRTRLPETVTSPVSG